MIVAHQPEAFRLPHGCIYLDTASHAPRLASVDAAARAALDDGAMPWRPSTADWEASIERVRTLASRLFDRDGHPDADGVAMVPSVAYAMSMVAASWPLVAGSRVLMLDDEFPSTLLPWQQRCRHTGARLQTVPRATGTASVVEAMERADIALLVLTQTHWRDGRLLDLDRIADVAHARGVALILDLSQSLGVLPCDVARWRPACVVGVGYKWLLGGKGLGYLWLDREWRERVEAFEHHWQTLRPSQPWVFDAQAMPASRAGARRLDAGEIADPLRLAIAEAGLRQVLEWTPAAIAARLETLTARLKQRLHDAGLGAACVEPSSPHILGIRPPTSRLDAVRAAFAREPVVCIEREGVFRVAPHVHVGEEQVDRVAELFVAAAG